MYNTYFSSEESAIFSEKLYPFLFSEHFKPLRSNLRKLGKAKSVWISNEVFISPCPEIMDHLGLKGKLQEWDGNFGQFTIRKLDTKSDAGSVKLVQLTFQDGSTKILGSENGLEHVPYQTLRLSRGDHITIMQGYRNNYINEHTSEAGNQPKCLTFSTKNGNLLQTSDLNINLNNREARTCVKLPYEIGPSDCYLDGLKFGIFEGPDECFIETIDMKYVIPYDDENLNDVPENPDSIYQQFLAMDVDAALTDMIWESLDEPENEEDEAMDEQDPAEQLFMNLGEDQG